MSLAQDEFDIVIVGAGPVGLLLSVCLARWGYKIKHIDNREIPTVTGRADGIQPRSLHILRNMGLKRQIMAHDPALVYEVSFWDPSPAGKGIHKTGNWSACPPFINARYPFTTLLHQGLIEKVFIDDMRKNGVEVQRPWTIRAFQSEVENTHYPVMVWLEHVKTGAKEVVKSKYLFSAEGSRSFVREQLGIKMQYKDPISHVWGVMDGVVRTDFPDVKMKCTIHSDEGSIMIIPRENNMVRLYIQIASSTDKDFNPRKQVTVEEVQSSAKKILKPYHIEWDRVEWYSVYPIGQGIAENYTLDQRVFMGGDCCHTHSPKAGQGMNTAFHDALNLAWKLHQVEAGFANRSILSTYESERRLIAKTLLDFDARYAALFSQRIPIAGEVGAASDDNSSEENEFVKTFKSSQEFTSGYGILYGANELNWSPCHQASSALFIVDQTKLRPGYVMPSANVTRVIDANKVHLEQEIPLNGSFRIFIFAGNPTTTKRAIDDFSSELLKKNSFYMVYQRHDLKEVSYHERHNPHSKFFTICTTFAASREGIDTTQIVPHILRRYSHHIYADDIWNAGDQASPLSAHATMGLDLAKGGVVVVRPDGHVGCAVKLVEGSGTVDALNEYFGAFVSKPVGRKAEQARL